MLVVDASALAAIVFGDENAEAVLDLIEGEELHAPSHFLLEMANATLVRCRRSPSNAAVLVESLTRVLSRPLTLHTVPALDVLTLALRTGLTAYDAGYLWLARSLGADLVTLDKQLVAAAAKRPPGKPGA